MKWAHPPHAPPRRPHRPELARPSSNSSHASPHRPPLRKGGKRPSQCALALAGPPAKGGSRPIGALLLGTTRIALVRSPANILETVPIHLTKQARMLPSGFSPMLLRARGVVATECWGTPGTEEWPQALFLFKLVLTHGVHRIKSKAPGGEQKIPTSTSTLEKAFVCCARAALAYHARGS